MDVAALIPAYNPDHRLVAFVEELRRGGRLAGIIVVDDGSRDDCQPLLARLAAVPRVTVLHHAVNLGKGAALKTGLNHFCCTMPRAPASSPRMPTGSTWRPTSSHVANRLKETPDSLVLGSRQFADGVPLRSRLGNVVTKYAFWGLVGKKLDDTQSGLAASLDRWPCNCCRVKNSGYEFELDMLVHCRQSGVPIVACPITTVYLDDNRSSHFHPLLDSLRIYAVFLRFIAASLVTAAVDYGVFVLVFAGSGQPADGAGRGAVGGPRGQFRRWRAQAVFRSRNRIGPDAGEIRPPGRRHGGDVLLHDPRGDGTPSAGA